MNVAVATVDMAQKILVVDDEPKIVAMLRGFLRQSGFVVVEAFDGQEALLRFEAEQPALVILDVMLPKLDGFEVARAIRKTSTTPIIMLTARTEALDRVLGLELGADDYVPKPFDARELVARVRAVLRRTQESFQAQRIEVGALSIDVGGHEVRLAGARVELTPLEFKLLVELARHPGLVHTRRQLLALLEGTTYAALERTVDTHIKNLRRKLEADPQRPKYILTVYGVGYKFERPDP